MCRVAGGIFGIHRLWSHNGSGHSCPQHSRGGFTRFLYQLLCVLLDAALLTWTACRRELSWQHQCLPQLAADGKPWALLWLQCAPCSFLPCTLLASPAVLLDHPHTIIPLSNAPYDFRVQLINHSVWTTMHEHA